MSYVLQLHLDSDLVDESTRGKGPGAIVPRKVTCESRVRLHLRRWMWRPRQSRLCELSWVRKMRVLTHSLTKCDGWLSRWSSSPEAPLQPELAFARVGPPSLEPSRVSSVVTLAAALCTINLKLLPLLDRPSFRQTPSCDRGRAVSCVRPTVISLGRQSRSCQMRGKRQESLTFSAYEG